jgi:hypothetical protein
MRTPAALLVAVAAATIAARVAGAQSAKDTLEVTRQAAETQRRVLVAGALPMTDAEARGFWPLFDDYEKARRPLDERTNRVVTDFLAAGASLTDAQAATLLGDWLKLEEARVLQKRDFAARMGRVLPARKLLRFFQIDNKLDAVIRADVTRQIPLAP